MFPFRWQNKPLHLCTTHVSYFMAVSKKRWINVADVEVDNVTDINTFANTNNEIEGSSCIGYNPKSNEKYAFQHRASTEQQLFVRIPDTLFYPGPDIGLWGSRAPRYDEAPICHEK